MFELANISFEKPDMDTFRGLAFAFDAMKQGGNIPTIFNAANEKAVALFLDRKIKYLEILDIIEAAMKECKYVDAPTVEQILETEQEVYDYIGSRW